MNETDLNSLVSKFNDLYISYRKEFLEQFKTGYTTRKYTLTDYHMKQHLLLNRTIGIRLGEQGHTFFMTFDVDVANDLQRAESITVNIVRTLHEYYGIEYNDIHVDFSGKKGYHITLFFDRAIQDFKLLPFYREVLERVGVTDTEVEFRCSSAYGMKLPLGVNQQTGAFMCFCDVDVEAERITKLSKSKSYEYFLNITQIDLNEFQDLILDDFEEDKSKTITTLSRTQAIEYESIFSELNVNGKTAKDLENEAKEIITLNRLKYPSSRHKTTLLLATFFRSQGYEADETIGFINNILLNTYENYRTLISADTSKEFMLKEVIRLVNLTYGRGYQFNNSDKEIRIYKSEIETILGVTKLQHKKLLFSLLIQSKRYANTNKKSPTATDFYTAYSTLAKMGNTKNRPRLLSYLLELEQMKLIEIVERNEIDKERSKAENRVISKPNRYRVLFESTNNKDKGVTLKQNEQIELEEVVAHFFTERKVRKLVPKGQWQTTFKKAY